MDELVHLKSVLENNRHIKTLSFYEDGAKALGVIGEWNSHRSFFFQNSHHQLEIAYAESWMLRYHWRSYGLLVCLFEAQSVVDINISRGKFNRLEHIADALSQNIPLQELIMSNAEFIEKREWQSFADEWSQNSKLKSSISGSSAMWAVSPRGNHSWSFE
jgi:hypothetical protein